MTDFNYNADEQKAKNPNLLRLWAIIATVAFLSALFWGFWQHRDLTEATAFLDNEYQRGFYNLIRSVDEADLLLGKALVSADPVNGAALFSELSSKAFDAVSILASLPLESEDLSRISSYYNQLGDYASVISNKLNKGDSLTDEDLDNLANLRNGIKNMSAVLARLEEEISLGKISFNQAGRRALEGGIISVISMDKENAMEDAMSYFKEIADNFSLSPEMEYEGAYSLHMSNKMPISLAPGEDIGMDKALVIAEEFIILIAGEGWQNINSSEVGLESALPAYSFTFIKYGDDNANIQVSVSKSGGKVISAYRSNFASVGNTAVSDEDILANVNKLFSEAGYPQMELISRNNEEDHIILTYVSADDKMIYYPDEVKIIVSSQSGEVLAFWASEYWMNTSSRNISEPSVSLEDAQNGLHSSLNVSNSRLAVVHDDAGREIVCHEFAVNSGSENYLIYIDGESGLESDIVFSHTDENGSLLRR